MFCLHSKSETNCPKIITDPILAFFKSLKKKLKYISLSLDAIAIKSFYFYFD